MTNVLFAARAGLWDDYAAPLQEACKAAGLDVRLGTEFAPEEVDYIIYAPNSDVQDFRPFTRLKAVMNLWAGVQDIAPNPTLTVPLTRMVDHGLRQGMVEWVSGHVLRHHLGMDRYLLAQDGKWRRNVPPLAQDRPVTILGLGQLGLACAEALSTLGFPVTGWSRREKSHPQIRCLHGQNGLWQALTGAQIVVLLLPMTDETENILDTRTLGLTARGAALLNPGRGGLIDDAALLSALESGQIGHATLDVFRIEPLPEAHPFWSHPNVTVTPHIASETRPKSAALSIAENIRRAEAGEPLLHLVDRGAGY